MSNFDKSIFVNCPFDKDYRQILIAILFTIRTLGYTPKLALDDVDCSEIRLKKITKLIEDCRIGIHDLSRIEAKKKGEHYRLNMPFELGMDFAAKTLSHGKDEWARKKILILEDKKYGYQIALSDLSGCDIKNHGNDPVKAVRVVRDWVLVSEKKMPLPSHSKIWNDFNDFNAYLADQLIQCGHKPDDTADIPIPEIMGYYDLWIK